MALYYGIGLFEERDHVARTNVGLRQYWVLLSGPWATPGGFALDRLRKREGRVQRIGGRPHICTATYMVVETALPLYGLDGKYSPDVTGDVAVRGIE
jgi:hypothetical protein